MRNKWRHNDVISRHSDIIVPVVIRISTYTILCKFGGLLKPPVPEGRKKPGLNRVKFQKKYLIAEIALKQLR